MTDYSSSRHHPSEEDEIDLFELVAVLWAGRWLLATSMIICALAAVAYVLIAPQQWTSTAQVSAPQLSQFGSYMDQRRAVLRAVNTKSATSIDVGEEEPLKSRELAKLLFDNFIAETAAARNKRDYLQKNDYFKETVKDQRGKDVVLATMAAQLKLQAPGKDQVTPYYTISFSAATAESAQDVLTHYLAHTNMLALHEVDNEFRSRITSRLQDWKSEIANTKKQLEIDKQRQIDELQNALDTAKQAGINDYLIGREESGNTIIDIGNSSKAYMLGKKYLSAELETTRNAPFIFPARYYQIKYKVEQVQPLLDYKADAKTYSYVLSPTLATSRDKPKRKLIVIAGVLAGGMLGALWILLTDALKRRRRGTAVA